MKDHNLAAGQENLQISRRLAVLNPRRLYLPISVQWEPYKMVMISFTFLLFITCPACFQHFAILQFGASRAIG